MYSGSGYSDWEIGDITIFRHQGVYHLFHLIIPNHDYIAHAVSGDGLSWTRTKNALFVGDPGEWDDDMLWTMHVFASNNKFLMYYTGLRREDRGTVSKIGMAESDDLIHWRKIQGHGLPVEISGDIYEHKNDNPRGWLSFRDPFYIEHMGAVYVLFCGRINSGPISRRGCVGLMKREKEHFVFKKPLVHPMVYDDVECPCIFQLNNRFYVIGSIREDIKVRYWMTDRFLGEYQSFHSDVLLPQGNYAARVLQDENHLLIYNFFYTNGHINSLRVLPPPKELSADHTGRLILKSFYRWEQMVEQEIKQEDFASPERILKNPTALFERGKNEWVCSSKGGYEIFYMPRPSYNFIWEGKLCNSTLGKFGLVTHIDQEGNGYFISFDLIEGLIQLRSWGYNPSNNRENFIFNNIQTNVCIVPQSGSIWFKLICYGNYIELSVDDEVKITLMDYAWSGPGLGLYTASSSITLQDSVIKILPDLVSEYASQELANKAH
ncbi:MAG: glycosyl hydrolase family 32 [Ferruginibacter sp.]